MCSCIANTLDGDGHDIEAIVQQLVCEHAALQEAVAIDVQYVQVATISMY